MQNAVYDTDLTDEQWRMLEPLLPKPSKTGRPRTCLRRVVNAILYALKTGCQWAILPKDFPPKSTVHGHFWAALSASFLNPWKVAGLKTTVSPCS